MYFNEHSSTLPMVEFAVVKGIVTFGLLVFLYCLECFFPYFAFPKGKLRHAFRNGSITIGNAVIVNLFFLPLVFLAMGTSWGVFARVELFWMVELLLTLLLLDIMTYWMHVAFHKFHFLWRFHRMHHSDTMMDVTTGARFHIGEHAISLAVRALLFAVFSMRLEYILIYELLSVANVFFHHANITLPERLDRFYRMFLTSPRMHKVHHSNRRKETDSNYTSLLSVWDRVFGTYVYVREPKRLVYGIKGLEDEQTVSRMVLTPLKK